MQVRCQGAEAKYLVRALQGKLRIGTAFQTVLVALSRTFADLQPAFAEDFASGTTNEDDIEEEGDMQMRTSKKTRVSAFAVEDDEVQKSAAMDVDSAASETPVVSSSSSEVSVEEMLRNVHDNETPEARKLRLHFTGSKRLSQQVRIRIYCRSRHDHICT